MPTLKWGTYLGSWRLGFWNLRRFAFWMVLHLLFKLFKLLFSEWLRKQPQLCHTGRWATKRAARRSASLFWDESFGTSMSTVKSICNGPLDVFGKMRIAAKKTKVPRLSKTVPLDHEPNNYIFRRCPRCCCDPSCVTKPTSTWNSQEKVGPLLFWILPPRCRMRQDGWCLQAPRVHFVQMCVRHLVEIGTTGPFLLPPSFYKVPETNMSTAIKVWPSHNGMYSSNWWFPIGQLYLVPAKVCMVAVSVDLKVRLANCPGVQLSHEAIPKASQSTRDSLRPCVEGWDTKHDAANRKLLSPELDPTLMICQQVVLHFR